MKNTLMAIKTNEITRMVILFSLLFIVKILECHLIIDLLF